MYILTKIFFIFADPPKNVNVIFHRGVNDSVTITCEADAYPVPTFEIYFNKTSLTSSKTYSFNKTSLVSEMTYFIKKMNDSFVGYYKCVAKNLLGKESSPSKYLPLQGTMSFINIRCLYVLLFGTRAIWAFFTNSFVHVFSKLHSKLCLLPLLI